MISAKNGIDAMIRIVLSFSFLYSQIDTASITTNKNNMIINTIIQQEYKVLTATPLPT